MFGKRKVEEVAPPVPLHIRIGQFRDELSDFIDDRVRQIKLGQPGLPEVSIRQMLIGNSNCMCLSALKVLGDIEKDKEIASRQS
jgi:hypothetical protein